MLSRHSLAIVILLITGAVLGQVCGFQFLSYDDSLNIYENPYVVNLTATNLLRFWQAPFQQLYIPVTYTFWSLLAWFSSLIFPGPEGQLSPFLFHAANLVVHLASVGLVFSLAKRLLGGNWPAAAGALLFAIHPVQVEAVAWATGMKDLLAGFFSLLSLWAYVAFAQKPPESDRRQAWLLYALATGSLIGALLAKPGTVVVPALAGVIGFGLLRRHPRRLALELLPWLLFTLPVIIITKGAQAENYAGFVPTLWQRILVASDALSFYLGKILWPAVLTVDYGRPPIAVLHESWLPVTAGLPWLVAVGLLAAAKVGRQPRPLCFALLSALALLPVSGFIPFTHQGISTVADRYLYLAMVGPALGLGWLLRQYRHRLVPALLIALLVGFGLKTTFQLQHWQNSEAFYRHTMAANPRTWFALNNYGVHLQKAGQLQEAEAILRRAVGINPFYARAYNNLGTVLAELNRDEEAIVAFQQAMKMAPGNEEPYMNIGNLHLEEQRWSEAMPYFRQAVSLRPDFAVAHASLGVTLKKTGRLREALDQFQKAIALNPNFPEVYNNLGIVFKKLGELNKSATAYRQAISLKTDFVEAHNNLGHLYLLQGLFQEALPFLKKAAALAPDQPVPNDNLGQAYAGLGRTREAVASFWRAIQADPSFMPARKNLARLQEQLDADEGPDADEE